MTEFVPRLPLIVAHRGGSPEDVENSLDAFKHALEIGAHLVECDIQLTRDREVVVWHDEEVDGLYVRDLTVDDLRDRIPTLLTLEELLDYLHLENPGTRITIDLKDRWVDRALVPILEERELTQNILITSRFAPGLRRLATRFPAARLGLSRGASVAFVRPAWLRRIYAGVLRFLYPFWTFPQLRWAKATTLSFQYQLLNPWTIERYHELGYRVYAWTVDDRENAEYLADSGVDMIATNVPKDMLDWLTVRRSTSFSAR